MGLIRSSRRSRSAIRSTDRQYDQARSSNLQLRRPIAEHRESHPEIPKPRSSPAPCATESPRTTTWEPRGGWASLVPTEIATAAQTMKPRAAPFTLQPTAKSRRGFLWGGCALATPPFPFAPHFFSFRWKSDQVAGSGVRVRVAVAARIRSTHRRHTGPRSGTTTQSGLALPRLHTRQIHTSAVICGRSPAGPAARATIPSQTATHSSQMKADEPAMSCRTMLCGALQNEQRYSRLLKKSNNESSRFTRIAPSRRKKLLDSAFDRRPSSAVFSTPCKQVPSCSRHRPWRREAIS